MLFIKKREDEIERFKRIFADELLEYHFERVIGKNENNEKQWRVLLEERVEPHADILCDLSQWLIDRGWSKDVVEELFFVAVKSEKPKKPDGGKKPGRIRSMFGLFKP